MNFERALLCGLGNTGSALLPLLAALPGLREVVLVDRDRIERANLACQAGLTAADVGRSKARVHARRLRGLRPGLKVVAYEQDLARIPLGEWHGALVAGCLDNNEARVVLNAGAFRARAALLLDLGVRADNRLARVSVLHPCRAGSACLECSWSEADYSPARHACAPPAPASGASAALGALAASLAMLEIEKLRDSALEPVAREVVVCADSHEIFSSALHRRSACRFEHSALNLSTAPLSLDATTLGEFFHLASVRGATALGCEGRFYHPPLSCSAGCGGRLAPGFRPRGGGGVCQVCGRPSAGAAAFQCQTVLAQAEWPPLLGIPLSRLGLRDRDVITLAAADGQPSSFLITLTSS